MISSAIMFFSTFTNFSQIFKCFSEECGQAGARRHTRVNMMNLVQCFTVKLTEQPKHILFKKTI